MSNLKDVKKSLEEALSRAREISNHGTRDELQKANDDVVSLQALMSETITKGANPCPHCGAAPHGMEQPNGRGDGVEYEVGCIPCGDFQHTDGTIRQHRVRGGMIPQHAVEVWNQGPDSWNITTATEVDTSALGKMGTSTATKGANKPS